MSRIGNKIITIPESVQITIDKPHKITVKGPRGTLSQQINPIINITINQKNLTCTRPTDQKNHKALHGLYRTLIQNMIIGVTKGYKKSLEVIGLGYKVSLENIQKKQTLIASIGYSHDIYFSMPPEATVKVEIVRGKNPIIHIHSNDKQLVGQLAAKIKSLRKPEPYKGRGIRYLGEKVRRKQGKALGK